MQEMAGRVLVCLGDYERKMPKATKCHAVGSVLNMFNHDQKLAGGQQRPRSLTCRGCCQISWLLKILHIAALSAVMQPDTYRLESTLYRVQKKGFNIHRH